MVQITLKIEGMQCGMCEAHVNDAVRRTFPVKKVTSSHGKGQTVIIAKEDIPEDKLRETIEASGYRVLAMEKAPYEKKGLFGR